MHWQFNKKVNIKLYTSLQTTSFAVSIKASSTSFTRSAPIVRLYLPVAKKNNSSNRGLSLFCVLQTECWELPRKRDWETVRESWGRKTARKREREREIRGTWEERYREEKQRYRSKDKHIKMYVPLPVVSEFSSSFPAKSSKSI